ncbi:hypothetical protein BDZ94DRAFT_907912 [Collybia nuda]|uniref:Uncharacterized protein n=1 Tax=Collybia nuda TaxID=64659 RepID=A0A9P5YD19_9AGAR|nr:hypothetical protein BDZ94DRAFT_907912 [Collybia nuda]
MFGRYFVLRISRGRFSLLRIVEGSVRFCGMGRGLRPTSRAFLHRCRPWLDRGHPDLRPCRKGRVICLCSTWHCNPIFPPAISPAIRCLPIGFRCLNSEKEAQDMPYLLYHGLDAVCRADRTQGPIISSCLDPF